MVNRNIIIYFVSLFFFFGPQIDKIMKGIGIIQNPFISIVSSIIGFVSYGALFLTIRTLGDAFENKKVTLTSIEKNYKDTLFKSIKVLLLLVFFVLIWFGIITNPKHALLPEVSSSLLGLPLIVLSPVFTYFSIFFAVENKSFFDSFSGAIRFYRRNILFTSLSMLFNLINWIILYTTPLNLTNNQPLFYIYEIIATYMVLIISAASLLYFKENNKEIKQINTVIRTA